MVGPGRSVELAAIVAELGSRALVCTGSNPARHEVLLESLTVPYVVSTVDHEPTLESARAARPLLENTAPTSSSQSAAAARSIWARQSQYWPRTVATRLTISK
jgi:hypothetical protein